MWSFFLAILNCFVRDKPGIAATAKIASTSVRPARDIAFVLIWNAEGKSIDFNSSGLREVKYVLVTIVKKPLRIDWLEMAVRLEIALSIFNRDRLDPVNRVLQNKSPGGARQPDYNFMRQHWIRWRRADVQKKRSVRS